MKAITFQNPGLIDINALKTFGVNSKTSESALGFFGTGSKYAVAIALRTGCKVVLYRGLQKFEFSVKSVHIQHDDFDVVLMNDDVMPYTLELGKTWEPWQAFREFWTNARDEEGDVFPGVVAPAEDKTTIQVTGAAFVEEYYKRSDIILQDKPHCTVNGTDIIGRKSKVFYYRGVRIKEMIKPTVLTYNANAASISLTEDRTAKYDHEVEGCIKYAVVNLTDPALIKTVLRATKNDFEGTLDFSDWGDVASTAFLDILQDNVDAAVLPANGSLVQMLARQRGKKFTPRTMTTTTTHQDMITEALRVINELEGIPTDIYDIHVTDSLPDTTLGAVIDEQVYIADRTLARGQRMVTGTIMEELMHRHLGYEDETYTFQNYLMDKLTEQLEYKADWRASALINKG